MSVDVEHRSGLERRRGDRRRGRPPLAEGEHASELTIRLSHDDHDWLIRCAAQCDVAVGAFTRGLLVAARALIKVSEKPEGL
jgi:hypothetical protein